MRLSGGGMIMPKSAQRRMVPGDLPIIRPTSETVIHIPMGL
jgi:hypothetical protein